MSHKIYNAVCIVPVYNEAKVLAEAIKLLDQLLRSEFDPENYKILIASNGSTDATNAIGARLQQEHAPTVELVVCKNKGRGAALREAVSYIDSNCFAYIDVDLPCDLGSLSRMIETVRSGADLVIAKRHGKRPFLRRTMTYSVHVLNRLAFGLNAADSQCAIKAMSPAAAQVLVRDCEQTGWYVDTELAVLAHTRKLKIREIDIQWIEQRFSDRQSKVKILRDSFDFLNAVMKIVKKRHQLQPANLSPDEASVSPSA